MASTDAMVPLVYAALQARAAQILDNGGGSLSPHSLVHDVLLKLYRAEAHGWRDETHFRAVASIAMRQILIDRARRKATEKHGANARHVSLSGVGADEDPVDLIALREALDSLEASQPRAAQVVVYRLLGGLGIEEIARELGCSESTVKREWRVGHAWIRRQLELR